MKYFKITEQSEDDPPRWQLNPLLLPDGGKIIPGVLADNAETYAFDQPLRAGIWSEWPGRRVSFTFAVFSIPILSEELALAVARLCPNDVQLFPVTIQNVGEPHYVLNVFRSMPCVDETRTIIQRWTKEDAEGVGEPGKAGSYRMVIGLHIDPSKVGDAKILRPSEWPIALVCSEEVRDLLERHEVTGVSFVPVT